MNYAQEAARRLREFLALHAERARYAAELKAIAAQEADRVKPREESVAR